jgi:outer membrane immunogenic protein
MKEILLATAGAVAMIATASAADIGYRRPWPPVAPAVVQVALPFSWTGCYLGGFAGGAWAGDVAVNNNYAQLLPFASSSWGYSRDSSFIGGGTAGCNWQPIGTPWVFGIEGELGYINLTGSASDPLFPFGPNVVFESVSGNAYGMVTGRLGYAVDRVLFYAKGGAAFVEERVTITHPAFPALGIPGIAVTGNNSNARWTVGAGIEWAFAGNWTLKGEYMFIGSDDISTCAGTFCWNHSVDGISTAKIGLNYLFGASGPLSAWY